MAVDLDDRGIVVDVCGADLLSFLPEIASALARSQSWPTRHSGRCVDAIVRPLALLHFWIGPVYPAYDCPGRSDNYRVDAAGAGSVRAR